MGIDKATPLLDVSGSDIQHDNLDGCILDGKVYKAKPVQTATCAGCAFTSKPDGMPEHCNKLACTSARRDDGIEVIWVEVTDHYDGEVS